MSDYAAIHAERLNGWFQELANHQGNPEKPLRFLLLERNAESGSGWWQTAFGRGGFGARAVQRLLDPAEPIPLVPIAASSERRRVIDETLEEAGSGQRPPEEGADPAFDLQLAELSWGGEPLFLMMAGLMAKGIGMANVLSLGRTDLAFELADRELSRIASIGKANGVNPDFMVFMAAYVTLCQGLDGARIRAAVKAEQAALGLPGAGDPGVVAKLLCDALPGSHGASPILPHMIGEAAILRALPERYDDSAATVLRAFQTTGAQVAASVIRTAQDFVEAGHPHPAEWLDALIERGSASVDQLWLIANELPEASLVLAEHGVRIYRSFVGTLRDEVRKGKTYPLPGLGVALTRLANRFRAVGQRQEALAPAHEAVDMFRELERRAPGTYRPDLAMTLNNLSTFLGEVGKHQEALATVQEAVAIRRSLVEDAPDVYQIDLALALQNLAICLSEVGQRQEALGPAQEAVAIRRALTDNTPEVYRPALASALQNLANRLGGVGKRQEALAPAREAVEILRELAARAPDTYRPNLAVALNNLANRLRAVGRHQEALARAQEAVAVRRLLPDQATQAHLPGLAMTLNNLSTFLAEVGKHQEALASAQEAVAIRRSLVEDGPDVYRTDLALALQNLAICLSDVGQQLEALHIAEEAVQTLTPSFLTLPDAFASRMSMIAGSYQRRCRMLGREPDIELLAPILALLERMQEGLGGDLNGRDCLGR